ncbi:hypothetical protein O9Z70_10505 [Devosia sp. YIM 151766]|nr:hypothetical protein [Devosia sp. YIM 151766]WIY51912.1 hypothetical protein O9Z70_10505 [Devosia sp. YIM 151766]
MSANIGVPPRHWVQHNLPWLAVLAMLFGFDGAEDDTHADANGRHG